MSAQFQLNLDRERYTPGDTIRGNIVVLKGDDTRSLEVLLEYNEEAEDDYSAIAASVSTGTLHAGDLATGMSFDFEVALPKDAFPNYRSEHGELYWQVDVKSDESGYETHERRRIEVEPVHRVPPVSGTRGRSQTEVRAPWEYLGIFEYPDLETAFRVLGKIAKLEVFETETFPAEEIKLFFKEFV